MIDHVVVDFDTVKCRSCVTAYFDTKAVLKGLIPIDFDILERMRLSYPPTCHHEAALTIARSIMVYFDPLNQASVLRGHRDTIGVIM